MRSRGAEVIGIFGWLRAGERVAEAAPEGPRKWLPVIDRDACTGCGRCVAACPRNSLEMVWAFATLVRPETCTGEGRCVDACPQGLIRMDWAPAAGDRSVGRWKEDA